MDRETIIGRLRAHESDLRAAGVASLSIFGSVARGEAGEKSDVDVVVRLDGVAAREGFAYFGRIDALRTRLTDILGRPVDLIAEPVQREDLRQAVARDGARAF